MDEMVFSYAHSNITDAELNEPWPEIMDEIQKMNQASQTGYQDDRSSINLCDDIKALSIVNTLINEKKKLHPRYIVMVGIGGSNLGTRAVQEAVVGKMYNKMDATPKILYAETVDPDTMNNLRKVLEPVAQKGETLLINIVSKSGTTTETIANFMILMNLVKKYQKNYENHVVVTTDKNSRLWKLAHKKGFASLEIPSKVGGRYSVLSPVGLFPLGLLGIDISSLLQGACLMKKRCLTQDVSKNPAALSASILYHHYKQGKNINDMFLFSDNLEYLGKWYRQLLGESIGKAYNKNGQKVNVGLTPTVSIGSTDLHSVAQLYLGGPYDKITSFVSLKQYKSDIIVPEVQDIGDIEPNIVGKPLSRIMAAILDGVKIAYHKDNRPYMEIILPDRSPESIGQFLQFKIMEIMYLGALLNVNPFDQPNVENYKTETRQLLSGTSKYEKS